MIISDWRSQVRSDLVPELRRAVDEASAIHGSQLVALSVHRLSRRFPLTADFDANLSELSDCWRSVRTSIQSTAMVVEFGGLLGATMRSAIGLTNALAGNTRPIKVFSRKVDALQWLVPQLRAVPQAAHLDHYLYVAKSLSEGGAD